MKERMELSGKEWGRLKHVERVVAGDRTLKWLAGVLGLSRSQATRVVKRCRDGGAAGLAHRSRGRRAPNAAPEAVRERVLALWRGTYAGWPATEFRERLEEDEGLAFGVETLRRWGLASGVLSRLRKAPKVRRRRERRPRFGELLQIDGSDHEWFGEGGGRAMLLTLIDDATGLRMSVMRTGETTEGVLSLLLAWFRAHGLPQAIYADRKAVCFSRKEDGESQFQRACRELGIELIRARSPQAKGRVERSCRDYQGRFVRELALRGVRDAAGADALLPAFDAKLNEMFARRPALPEDGHVRAADAELERALCESEPRTVARDGTVRFRNRILQLGGGVAPRGRVTVRLLLDGRLLLEGESGGLIGFREVAEPPKRAAPPRKAAKRSAPKPSSDHFWNVMARQAAAVANDKAAAAAAAGP